MMSHDQEIVLRNSNSIAGEKPYVREPTYREIGIAGRVNCGNRHPDALQRALFDPHLFS